MKKLIAFAIAAIMVISMIPAMAFTASAENAYPEPFDGFWTVYRDPDDYATDAESYKPAPGYKYTSEGFQLTSADYTNMTPKWTVQSSRPVDLKQGFYMQFRVDEFSYKGTGETPADEWISLSISDRPLVAHGNTVHGNNWCSLIRGAGDGKADLQSFVTVQTTDEDKGGFNFQGGAAIDVPMQEDKEVYTLEIVYDGTNYDIKVNGVSASGGAEYTKAIASYEECYVGLTFHSGVKDGVASATILKQGTSASDAETPDGNDEGEAEDNTLNFGERIDINSLLVNQPAMVWDAHKSSFKGDPNSSSSSLNINPTGDYTYHMQASGSAPYFMWSIKSELTYHAEDLPVFVMMMKDYMGDNGQIRYCSGDIMSADDTHIMPWDQYAVDDEENPISKTYGADDEYVYVVVDMSEALDWEGRINSIRPEFAVDANDEEWSEWDIEFMAFFRSIEEAHAYGDKYIVDKLGSLETSAPETDPETDPVQETEDNKETTANGTTDGTTADTNQPAGTTGNTAASGSDDEGCASVIAVGAVAILAAAAAAVVLKKKD